MEQLIQIMRLDEPDEIGIIYPTLVVKDAVQNIEERIQHADGVLGECSPPPRDEIDESDSRLVSIDLARTSHIVKHLWIEDRTLMCKVKLLGKYADIAKHMNVEFHGVPRATGIIDGKEPDRVCTKYTIITIDLALIESI